MDFYKVNELASQCRRNWNINLSDPIDIFSLVLDKIKNLTIVFLVMNDDISGACYKSSSESIIFINSTHSKGRQSFTIAHEVYHLNFDDNNFNICGVASDDEVEKIADQFASSLLMPQGALESYKNDNNIETWSLDEIIAGEQYFQISHQAFLWRLRKLNEISYEKYMDFKKDIKYNASIRGYNLSLYEPYLNKKHFTLGNYICLVEKAYNNDLISIGRKEEYLLEAYCEDLVYNASMEDL